MSKNILIISNCQTDQVRLGLEFIFPKHNITFKAIPQLNRDTDQIVGMLSKVDIALVHSHWYSEVKKLAEENRIGAELFRIPDLYFNAFHPDLVYIIRADNNQLIVPHYNSAIVAWAYNHNIPEKMVESFFNAQIFSDLGYLSLWSQAVDHLKSEFEACSLDFYKWYLPVKRSGIFMYSMNHPRRKAITEYVRVISSFISKSSSIWRQEIHIPDSLWWITWPVYPDIANALGQLGDYTFTIAGSESTKRLVFHTVNEYIHYAYNVYNGNALDPGQLIIGGIDSTLYDKVLGEWYDRNA